MPLKISTSSAFVFTVGLLAFLNMLTAYMEISTSQAKASEMEAIVLNANMKMMKNELETETTVATLKEEHKKKQIEELQTGTLKGRDEKKCVSKLELQQLVNSTQNVIILMPAKAAGTSFKNFAKQCSQDSFMKLPDNVLNSLTLNEKNKANFLMSSYELPQVIASHMYSDEAMRHLFKHASKDTLFIWSHREETSRLMSAIKCVFNVLCDSVRKASFELLENTKEKCVISEDDLVHKMIEIKKDEIKYGTERLLTCDTYDAMRDNLPNLVIADYKIADDVQTHIAQKYCPEVLEEAPVRSNVATDIQKGMYVKLSKTHKETAATNHTVYLDDWLRVKHSHIEMLLGMKEKISCQATTRRLENALESCDDHMVKITTDWIG